LFVYDRQWNASPAIDLPALASALNLLVLLVSLVLSLRWGTLTSAGQEEQALTLALFLSLVATSAPVAEGYHYVMVLPALLVALWWAWLSACDWPAWAALGLAVLLLAAPLPYRSPGLQDRWLALLAYPRVYGAFILWGWLGWALERLRKRNTTS
jgi:hypothetical protein